MSAASTMRQQVLSLWMAGSALDENVIAWAFHGSSHLSGDWRVLLHTGGVTWPERPSPPRIRTRQSPLK